MASTWYERPITMQAAQAACVALAGASLWLSWACTRAVVRDLRR